jgi:hypothetical protein
MEERISLLQNFQFLKTGLHVCVLSVGDWSWALAWAQLGVDSVHCVPVNAAAAKELSKLQSVRAIGSRFLELPYEDLLESRHLHKAAVLCGHVSSLNEDAADLLRALKILQQTARSTLVSVGRDNGRDAAQTTLGPLP